MRSLYLAFITGAAALSAASAQNLLENGSFESPVITGRKPVAQGGDPASDKTKSGWVSFTGKEDDQGGKLIVGMTEEIARTGKQAIYVDFEKLTAVSQLARLESKLMAIKPAQTYRISIWGRIDRDRPISLDERRPHMWLDVEYFEADQETVAGDTEHSVQLIPGRVVLGESELVYTAGKWTEFAMESTSPEKAAFLRITWSWIAPKEEGETDGIVYWDDAGVLEAAAPSPAEKAPPATAESSALKAVPATRKPPGSAE